MEELETYSAKFSVMIATSTISRALSMRIVRCGESSGGLSLATVGSSPDTYGGRNNELCTFSRVPDLPKH